MSVNRIWKGGLWRKGLQWATGALGLLPLGLAIFSVPVFAQIFPDNTLGTESSLVTPNVNIRGLPGERIDGGAVRGSALFHSFSEFNVNNGQRVYFSNPAGIADIFSRVTGSNVSNILGRLGVDGGANLFVLNPNGILFGPNAQLDIQGSFLATTGSSVKFSDGSEFSATQPTSAPLLSINVTPGVQWGANQPGATITNRGNLSAGQDLTLAGGNLDLQGQLQAGRDLTLQAQDTVKVRDSLTTPLIAAAGGKLVVQGNQGVDIFALNHPDSGLFSGGDMVLRSANTVGGDAHYWSGGSFRIETLDSNSGSLSSPNDPVIRASGDVSFGSYTGASLHIFAGGSVTVTGSIEITGADATNGIVETVSLSDGTPLEIDGKTEPTLDIRAGTTEFGTPLKLTGTPSPTNLTYPTNTLNRADIKIDGTISNPGGLVFLTNQFQPNGTAGNITVNNIGTRLGNNDVSNSGAIFIDSRSNFFLSGYLSASTFGQGDAGIISIKTSGAVNLDGSNSIIFNNVGDGGVGNAGLISIKASSLSITNGAQVQSLVSKANGNQPTGQNNAGKVEIDVRGAVTISGDSLISTQLQEGRVGQGGDINITSGSFLLKDGASLSSSTFGQGDAGSISIKTLGTVELNGSGTKIFNNVGAPGVGKEGLISIEADSFLLKDGAQLTSSTFGQGDAGSISIKTLGTVELDGSNSIIFNNVGDGGVGNAGLISIKASSLSITNGAQVQSLVSKANGNQPAEPSNGGKVDINVQGAVTISGKGNQYTSLISTELQEGRVGRGGDINITSGSLLLQDGTQLRSSTFGQGNGGDIKITALNSVTLSINGQLLAETKGSGQAGSVNISTPTLNVNSGAKVSTTTTESATGTGGDITVKVNTLNLSGADRGLLAETRGVANAGSLTLNPYSGNDLQVNFAEGAKVSASTSGSGQGGSLNVTAPNSVTLRGNGQLSAEATNGGNAGGVTINTQQLSIGQGAQVATSSKKGSGTAGDVDITASTVTLNEGKVTAETDAGGSAEDSANITLRNLNTLNLNNSKISASTQTGQAGSVNLNQGANPATSVSINNSSISAQATEQGGNAGGVTLNTSQLSLENGAKISASNISETSQNITLQGLTSLSLSNGSEISASTQRGSGGNVSVEAEGGTVELSGNSRLAAEATNGGNAGGITINTQQLTIEQGAQVAASSEKGSGTAGDVDITASTVTLNNGQITAETDAGGSAEDSANITLRNLNTLNLSNNSSISASTQTGQAGSINLNQEENPAASVTLNNSHISAQADGEGGHAGGVTLNTSQLSLNNRAKISASNISGTSQDITLQGLNTLQLSNNSEISASTESGKGGSVSVKAPGGTVALTGNSSLKAEATQGGQAGNLDITANQLTLRDSSATVSSPQGQAGNLSITANNLSLNGGQITAATGKRSEQGGANIKLQVTDLLLLRHNSLISANATGDANGGNINIRAPFVVAVPSENNDIIANAFSGNGGQINIIDNYRVFGLKPQSRQSFNTLRHNRTSDISASSQSGIQGVINIQSLSVDPSQGLTELPVEVIDPSRQIVNRCGAGNSKFTNAQGEFVVTGRGGLPPSPDDMQTSGAIPPSWVTRDVGNSSRSAAPVDPPATPSSLPLVEAQGMFINAKGEVVLTAQTSTTTPHQPGFAEPLCSPGDKWE